MALDPTYIIVSILGTVPPTIAASAALITARRSRNDVSAVHEEVRTNHGMRAGEYLESIAAAQTVQSNLLLAHTTQDEGQFKAIHEESARLRDVVETLISDMGLDQPR